MSLVYDMHIVYVRICGRWRSYIMFVGVEG